MPARRLLLFAPALVSFALACGTADEDASASAGDSALVAAPPGSGCVPGKEGQICGTQAKLGCDVALACDAPPTSLLIPHPAGVCRAPNRPPAANPSKPICAPSKAGGPCGSEAELACGPGLTCILPDTGSGLVVPTGTCRIAEGQPCTPEPLINSGCAGMLLCDFDRDRDPLGKSAKCVTPAAAKAKRCDSSLNGNACSPGFSCSVIPTPCTAGPCTMTTFCQKIPADRELGEACGGLSSRLCKDGLECAVPGGFLPGTAGVCMKPSDVSTECVPSGMSCNLDLQCCSGLCNGILCVGAAINH
jgi:hypothetical protein